MYQSREKVCWKFRFLCPNLKVCWKWCQWQSWQSSEWPRFLDYFQGPGPTWNRFQYSRIFFCIQFQMTLWIHHASSIVDTCWYNWYISVDICLMCLWIATSCRFSGVQIAREPIVVGSRRFPTFGHLKSLQWHGDMTIFQSTWKETTDVSDVSCIRYFMIFLFFWLSLLEISSKSTFQWWFLRYPYYLDDLVNGALQGVQPRVRMDRLGP